MPWLGAAGATVIFGLLVAMGTTWTDLGFSGAGDAEVAPFAFTTIIAFLVFLIIGSRMGSGPDHTWLLKWVIIGFAAKVVGTIARFYMVVALYGGGDSYRYFRVGTEFAESWRRGQIPTLSDSGAFGTQILEYLTGILLAVFTPEMMVGFLLFSLFAYGGQLMLYAAFRRWAKPWQLKPYALLLLFLPSFVFWPSSIGKDAIVVFAVGAAAYFSARVLDTYEVRFLVGLALSLGLLGLIRVHVAGLVVVGLILAGLISKMRADAGATVRLRRLLTVGSFIAAAAVLWAVFPDIFGVDLTSVESLDSFTSDVVRRTSEKGTVAAGGPVAGPGDVPGAIVLALFRPLITEASELQHFFAAAETTLLLGVALWKLPAMVRNWRSWRPNGFLVFSTFYVISYSIAFSVVRNLGIIARQRGQVLAFFLAVLVGLGWEERRERIVNLSDLTPRPELTPPREPRLATTRPPGR
ncbi:MAG TPA: hypothetical protein VJ948_08130 [Acidimicrobiia bacterium]|nr:hypothetical protein [Acidimicrobiia bacterium]